MLKIIEIGKCFIKLQATAIVLFETQCTSLCLFSTQQHATDCRTSPTF